MKEKLEKFIAMLEELQRILELANIEDPVLETRAVIAQLKEIVNSGDIKR